MKPSQHFFDPETCGFLEAGVQPIPPRAVPITRRRYAELLDGQAEGAQIVVGSDTRPRLRRPSTAIHVRRAGAIAAARQEARRRIIAIAPSHVQSNDNAAIASAALQIAVQGSTLVDFAPALDRRRNIDGLRARSAALELRLATMSKRELSDFDPRSELHWQPGDYATVSPEKDS